MPVSKKEVLLACRQMITGKKDLLLSALRQVEESLLTETKSTAGDKHETGRAHLQAGQSQLLAMLNEVLELEKELNEAVFSANSGSGRWTLVHTDKGIFFLGLPLGRVQVDGEQVFSISHASPLGSVLLRKTKGETFSFREITYRILQVE